MRGNPQPLKKRVIFVHAYSHPTQGKSSSIECQRTMSKLQVCDRKVESPYNTPVLVDTFEDKFHIAASLDIDILNSKNYNMYY